MLNYYIVCINISEIKYLVYLNVVGDKSAVTGDGNRKLVVATCWLAGHEIQLKHSTVDQKKDLKTLDIIFQDISLNAKDIKHSSLYKCNHLKKWSSIEYISQKQSTWDSNVCNLLAIVLSCYCLFAFSTNSLLFVCFVTSNRKKAHVFFFWGIAMTCKLHSSLYVLFKAEGFLAQDGRFWGHSSGRLHQNSGWSEWLTQNICHMKL